MRVYWKIFITLLLIAFIPALCAYANNTDEPDYTTFRTIDRGTFNQYRFELTEQFFALREHYRVRSELNVSILWQMLRTADEWAKYLPDNLRNRNALRELATEIKRWVENPRNEFIYNDILRALVVFIEQVDISSIQWSIEATPLTWNAPLITTFRVNASDPTWTQINNQANIRWWINEGWREREIGRWVSINYTFNNEWRYTVFVDVISSHKNSEWNTDVLPYRWRIEVNVQERIASLNIRVNSDIVRDNDILKFTPDVANFWLVIDATNSLPSGWNRFIETEWDFWNGIQKKYSGPPRIERARYANEGEYTVRLKLTTNEGKTIEKKFELYIHNPIAKIEVNRQEGFIGDRFSFQSKIAWNDRNATYNWEIIDIDRDRVIAQQNDRNFSYVFSDKWRYNVRLRVRKSSWETDQDTRIIVIESRNPIAEFNYSIPERNRPNRVFLDGTRSFDPDLSDNAKLEYVWYVNWDRIILENPSMRGSTGYYTFSDVGTYIVSLEVIDPDGLRDIKQHNIIIESILSVDFEVFPRVAQRESTMRFVAESPEAQLFEWDFWDGTNIWWSQQTISYSYMRSGSFRVNLRVTDRNNNTNTFSRNVFIADSDSPLAVIDASINGVEIPQFDSSACNWEGAYIVDRVSTIRFDARESINIDGSTRWLEYSWRVGNSKFTASQSTNHRFDEVGCFPIVLTVRSTTNWRTDRVETRVSVKNLPPTLTDLDIRIQDESADPLFVEVRAQGANDPDGVIQSYMWYYYTDTNPEEPQEFRATRTPSTTFVIPRITWNYYFVAVLRDNNEKRITSEEITNSRHFITVSWDNINTPLVWLRVNQNSISVWDEVTFSVTAENILNQDISGDATYHWDFNGDGFYNMQTSVPTVNYVYRNSWRFYAKVKVTYRWMSSTRSVTIDVTNRLRADFWYFSIWNRYVFFDMSSGQVASRQWDMWNGETRSWNNFIYTFADGKSSRDITLRVSEWSRVDEITKTVRNNPRNVLKARQSWVVAFTYPEKNEDGNIVLDLASDRVFVYMWESTESAAYVIDFDIEHDSNLDGSRDSDEDNKWTASYVNGSIIEIPLNALREQTMRLFLKDEEGNVTASEDITIIKKFIEDQTIDPDTIVFENVSEEEREKLDRLKRLLSDLPQLERLQSLQFVQQLQQDWFDPTEKTRTIIDFMNYIFELNLHNEDEIVTLLESLLIIGQEDQSQLQVIYQALINLLPVDIQCSVESWSCYDNIISKLTDIRQSEDVEYNRSIGRDILQVVAETDLMTNEQKLDFRAILVTLVYRGDVNSIPEEERQEIIEQTPTWSTRWIHLFSVIINISLVIWGIFWVFLFILLVLYIVYRTLYKWRDDVSFQQFITRSTWNDTKEDDDFDAFEDVLSDIEDTSKNDILSFPDESTKKVDLDTPQQTHTWKKVDIQSWNVDKKESTEKWSHVDEVPSWLKWSFPSSKDALIKNQDNNMREWGKVQNDDKILPKQGDSIKSVSQESDLTQSQPSTQWAQEDFESAALPEDSQVPDWLKWSFETSSEPKKVDTIDIPDTQMPDSNTWDKKWNDMQKNNQKYASSDNILKEEKLPENILNEDIIDTSNDSKPNEELNIPDWLKWSFDPHKKTQVQAWEWEDGKEIDMNNPLDISSKSSEWDNQEEATSVSKKKDLTPTRQQRARTTKKTQTPSSSSDDKNLSKDESVNSKEVVDNTADELWDDGMKIPDWLKTPDKDDTK